MMTCPFSPHSKKERANCAYYKSNSYTCTESDDLGYCGAYNRFMEIRYGART